MKLQSFDSRKSVIILCFVRYLQWRGESEAAGEAADQWCPPVVLVFFLLLGLKGAKTLEAPKNLHLTVPKIDQKHVDGYAFFMCIAVQSHRKIPEGPKF